MRKLFYIFAVAVIAALFAGCTSTRSTVTEYDAAGNIVKTTVSSESVISSVVDSTKNKTVVMWEDGWAAYVSVSSGTTEDPTPHGKIFAGKVNKGAISMLPGQQGLPGIARIVQATKSDLSADLGGVSSSSSEIQTKNKETSDE